MQTKSLCAKASAFVEVNTALDKLTLRLVVAGVFFSSSSSFPLRLLLPLLLKALVFARGRAREEQPVQTLMTFQYLGNHKALPTNFFRGEVQRKCVGEAEEEERERKKIKIKKLHGGVPKSFAKTQLDPGGSLVCEAPR